MIVAISVKAGEIEARVRRFDAVMEDAGDAACYIRASEVDVGQQQQLLGIVCGDRSEEVGLLRVWPSKSTSSASSSFSRFPSSPTESSTNMKFDNPDPCQVSQPVCLPLSILPTFPPPRIFLSLPDTDIFLYLCPTHAKRTLPAKSISISNVPVDS